MKSKFYLFLLITCQLLAYELETKKDFSYSVVPVRYYYYMNELIDTYYFWGVINRFERRDLLNELMLIRRFQLRAGRDGFVSLFERNRLFQLKRRFEIRLRQLEHRLQLINLSDFWFDRFDEFDLECQDDFWNQNLYFPRSVDELGYRKKIDQNASQNHLDENNSLRNADSYHDENFNNRDFLPENSIEEFNKRKHEVQKERKIDWENLN